MPRPRVLPLLAVLLLACGGACGDGGASGPSTDAEGPTPSGTEPSAPPPAPPAPPAATADAGGDGGGAPDAVDAGPVAPFHLVGRVDTRDPAAPMLGFPGSEIRVRFAGPVIEATLSDRATSLWDVAVDGVLGAPLAVSGPLRVYGVASGLGPGPHDVVLTKRTETLLGVTTLHDLAAPGGTIVPSPVPNGRRLEFVGDSITCGFGVLGADATCPFTAETESEPSAWAARASKQLSALHTSVCWSGLGVYRNFGGETTGTMPELYGRAIADDPTSVWDHSFVPDAVVVALGTNDFAGGKGDPGPAFADAYAAFLTTVRAAHPASAIVLATSPMLSTPNHELHRGHLLRAMEMRAAAGDTNLSLVDIPEQDESDGLGCGYHPSLVTQEKMAARLVAHLKQTLGW